MKGAAQDMGRNGNTASSLEALPVALATGAPQMSTAAGDPIWPYSDLETLAALTRISELFDCQVADQQPCPADGESPVRRRREGVVISARADVDDVASLYAHLTNRLFLSAGDCARGEARRPDVVVSPPDVLTPQFLRQLYSDPEWAPGLITGPSPEALLRQALVRSAAVSLRSRTMRRRVDVQQFAELGEVRTGGREIFGRQAGRAELRRALASGSDLLTITSVGDGIDAGLGPLTLCPMDRTPARFEGTAPPCIVTGICHRLQLPMAEALASGASIPPEAISARVLILHACWGIQPAGALHSPAWGYGYRLADHDGLGAMLTTWEITIASPSDTEPLARDLVRGVPVGRALARFNHSASSRQSGKLMCLLGDPDLRISTAVDTPTIWRSAPRDGTSRQDCGQLAFLAAYLDTMTPKDDGKALLAAARDAVAACERRAWSGLPIDAPGEECGTTMRQRVLEFLCSQGTIPAYHWMAHAYPVSGNESGTRCRACGQLDREVTFRLRIPGAGSRKLKLCPRCGLTEDRPATMDRAELTITDDMACLHMVPPRGAWNAALLFRPRVGEPIARPWPAGEDHTPSPAVPVPSHDPAESPQLLLFMMEGAALSIPRALSAPVI